MRFFNKTIPFLFMVYQAVLLMSTIINPAVCILIIVGKLMRFALYYYIMNVYETLLKYSTNSDQRTSGDATKNSLILELHKSQMHGGWGG